MDCGESKSGWNVLHDALALYLKSEQIQPDPICRNCFEKGNNKFFVLPLCELERLRDIRQTTKDYDSPVIFLISNKDEMPYRFNKKIQKKDREELFGNPRFGNISQAILRGEILTPPPPKNSREDSKNNCTFQQFLNVNDETFPKNLHNTINKLIETRITEENNINSRFGKFRRMFYDTFVDYYFPDSINLQPAEESYGVETGLNKILKAMTNSKFINKFVSGNNDKGESKKSKTKLYKKLYLLKTHSVELLMTWTDVLYCYLNGVDYNTWTHRVEHEFFRAPIPFPLHELIVAKGFIEKNLHEQRIKLLLIDNRLDKVRPSNGKIKKSGLLDALFHEEIDTLFELKMLGNNTISNKADAQTAFNNTDKFNSKIFKNDLNKIIAGKLQDTELTNNYAWQVYKEIKKSNFILLDFFLNKENTYLAFDFIRDIAEIKRQKGDVSTTWYFITSAVYDSVVKYSQSGLLAEYYESAVVSAGDDPTNERRQIIFIYKLLTFIQARLRSFKNFKKAFNQSNLFKNNCEKSTDYCKDLHKCLYPIQALCRKYLGEYNEIIKIFPGIRHEKRFKEHVELTDNIINQFLWLPEADWPMIQRQIEHLNVRLEKEGLDNPDETEIKFSCKYILDELQKRSEIY